MYERSDVSMRATKFLILTFRLLNMVQTNVSRRRPTESCMCVPEEKLESKGFWTDIFVDENDYSRKWSNTFQVNVPERPKDTKGKWKSTICIIKELNVRTPQDQEIKSHEES